MQTIQVTTYTKDGTQFFGSKEARKIAGIRNRGTWNRYLISIGKPTGENSPTLTTTDLIWVWICKKWIAQNKRISGISTHAKFREIRWKENDKGELKYSLDDFLDTLETDLLTITIEVQKAIHGNRK